MLLNPLHSADRVWRNPEGCPHYETLPRSSFRHSVWEELHSPACAKQRKSLRQPLPIVACGVLVPRLHTVSCVASSFCDAEKRFMRRRKTTILRIDDDGNSLEGLKTLLALNGYHVLIATSGYQGSELLAPHRGQGMAPQVDWDWAKE